MTQTQHHASVPALPDSFSALDLHFGALMQRLSGMSDPLIGLTAALASYSVQNGHSCCNLRVHADTPVLFEKAQAPLLCWPALTPWINLLLSSGVVGKKGEYMPLILDGERLYLYRYWRYEQLIANQVNERCSAPPVYPADDRMQQILDILFPHPVSGTDWQKVAVAAAMFKKFLVISGGPGTGKTSTVVKLIAAAIARAPEHSLRVAVTAPTGKAAIRLQEALTGALPSFLERLQVPRKPCIHCSTLHALLKPRPHSPYFHHDHTNPLPLDLIVVDEASMADQALMAKLLDALPTACSVVLVGDKDQLSSVEAGAVLADLCGNDEQRGYSKEMHARLGPLLSTETINPQAQSPIADSVVILRRSYRFDETSGIGTLARMINAGDAEKAIALLASGHHADLAWWSPPSLAALNRRLAEIAAQHLSGYLNESDPAAAIKAFNHFRVLCAVRQGSFGVLAQNDRIERSLALHGWITPRGRFYRGKPCMLTRNDYDLDLYNGDTGITLEIPGKHGELKVCFLTAEGAVRQVSTTRLGPFETAFAITVHKAQGSEFDETLVILPPGPHPLVTRELLYTALTRARTKCEIWATRDVLAYAIQSTTTRESGLAELLWNTGGHYQAA